MIKRSLVISIAVVIGVVLISYQVSNNRLLDGQIFIFPHPNSEARHYNNHSISINETVSQLQFQISDLQQQLDHYRVLQQTINDNITAIQNQINILQDKLVQAKQIQQVKESAAVDKLVVGILHFYNTDRCFNSHLNTNGTGYIINLSCGHIRTPNSTTITGAFNVTVIYGRAT
jgi:hypothetical protein